MEGLEVWKVLRKFLHISQNVEEQVPYFIGRGDSLGG